MRVKSILPTKDTTDTILKVSLQEQKKLQQRQIMNNHPTNNKRHYSSFTACSKDKEYDASMNNQHTTLKPSCIDAKDKKH
jgi:hypothetical protein